jgi:hypothetical protein
MIGELLLFQQTLEAEGTSIWYTDPSLKKRTEYKPLNTAQAKNERMYKNKTTTNLQNVDIDPANPLSQIDWEIFSKLIMET